MGQLSGDISENLRAMSGDVGEASLINISCTKLIRLDFMAAGDLLNWVLQRRSENRTVVFVRTSNGFRAVPVMAGRRNGDQVIISSGLTGQERIATTNSFTLKAELGKGGEMDMD